MMKLTLISHIKFLKNKEQVSDFINYNLTVIYFAIISIVKFFVLFCLFFVTH